MLLVTLALAAPWSADLATGNCSSVVAALPSPTTDAERLGAGYCLERLGEDLRADTLLAGVRGPLAPYAVLVRGRALLDAKRAAEALALLGSVDVPGTDDDLLRGRALILGGKPAEGRAVLARLTTAPKDTVAAWNARAIEIEGGDALPLWRDVWARFPTSPQATLASERLATLGHPVPSTATPEDRALALRRADTLVDMSQAAMAIPLYDLVFAVESNQRPTPFADALFEAKLYARARDAYAAIGTSTSATAFRHALATARAGDYPAAANLYRALVVRWPTAKEADEASWKPAYMDYDAARYPEAIAGFDAYLAARPTGKFAPDAKWLRAWSLVKLDDRERALPALATAATLPGDLGIAAKYWRGVLTSDSSALTALAKESPDSGYAWFAAQRADPGAPKRPPAAPPPLATLAFSAAFLVAHPEIATARLLLDAGFTAEAAPLLKPLVKSATTDTDAVALALALVEAGEFRTAQALACPRVSRVPAARDGCWPRPHLDTVTKIALAHGLDPLLPYAIMTAESGLDPSVTSPAGARGLMQLMPALAGPLAKGQVDGFVTDDLYHAGINARLGTTELGQLQARFGSAALQPSLPLVIAAYNGGPDAVQRWVDAAPGVTIDRWAEDISFTETRRYVRRVLGYLMRYHRMFGAG